MGSEDCALLLSEDTRGCEQRRASSGRSIAYAWAFADAGRGLDGTRNVNNKTLECCRCRRLREEKIVLTRSDVLCPDGRSLLKETSPQDLTRRLDGIALMREQLKDYPSNSLPFHHLYSQPARGALTLSKSSERPASCWPVPVSVCCLVVM